MGKLKIKAGDTVRVLTGDHKNEEGKIVKILTKKNRAIVEGVNMVSKHAKPSADNPQGGIIKKEASIHISNLGLIENGSTVRVGYKAVDGKKVRISRKTDKAI